MCFFKRQESEHAGVKELGTEQALDRQAHGRDFDDMFAGTKGTKVNNKVNMEDIIPGGKDLSHLANSATKMNVADDI